MNKFIRSVVVLMFFACFIKAGANKLNYSIHFDSDSLSLFYHSENGVKYIIPSFPGTQSSEETGLPVLPIKSLVFALPTEASNIYLTDITYSSPISINLDFPVINAQDPLPIGEKNKYETTLTYTPRSVSYSDKVLVNIISNYKDFVKLAYISLFPTDYDAEKGILKLYEDFSFSISYEITEDSYHSKDPFLYIKDNEQEISSLSDMVENPEFITYMFNRPSLYADLILPPTITDGNAYEYTIVTNGELAPSFQRLVSLKRMQGLNAGIVLIEDILSNPLYSSGDPISHINDDAGKLKSFLWRNRGIIRYVLLGGKPPIVPIRYGYESKTNIEQIIPTDLYFSTGEETNWNYYNDGYYGQRYKTSSIDYFSYMSYFSVGRLLCKTPEDVNNYIDKLEIYELNPGFGDTSYLNNFYFTSSNDLATNKNATLVNHFKESLIDKFSFSSFNGGVNSVIMAADVVRDLNNRRYGCIAICGHGNPEGISTYDHKDNNKNIISQYGLNALDDERVYLEEELNNGIDNLNNFGYPNILFAHSCSTNPFDSPRYMGFGIYNDAFDIITCNFSESFTNGKKYGGVAYFGYTRPSYTSPLGIEQMDYFFNNYQYDILPIRIGNILSQMQSQLSPTFLGINSFKHINILGLNLIGDPALVMWNGTVNIEKSRIQSIKREGNGITVTIPKEDAGAEFNNTIICIDPNGKIYKNMMGHSNITHIDNIPEESVVYLQSSNKIPYVGDLSLGKKTINTNNFLYVNNATIGSTKNTASYDVIFSEDFAISANGIVDIYKNTSITDNKTLSIYTSKKCNLHNFKIPNNGKLIIYADTVTTTISIDEEIASGKIVIYGYEKNKPNGVESIPVLINSSMNKSRAAENKYIPLLEQGKEWHYTRVLWSGIYHPQYATDKPREIMETYRIEGTVEIDGEEYQVLKSYLETAEGSRGSFPVAYLREDTDAHKVWAIISEECEDNEIGCLADEMEWYGTNLMYDFNFSDATYFVARDSYGEVAELSCCDGPHQGVGLIPQTGKTTEYYIIEGIGLIGADDDKDGWPCNLMYYGRSFIPDLPPSYYYPYLYEVVSGNGEVIYYNEKVAPGFAGAITAKADSNATVKVFNLQGMKVRECDASANPTNGLAPGVYLIRKGGVTSKIHVGNR